MGQVVITVNGSSYTIKCGDGEEGRLSDLARRFDERVMSLRQEVGQVGDSRLLVMVGLILFDRLDELQGGGGLHRSDLSSGDLSLGDGVDSDFSRLISSRLASATDRLEDLARRLSI